MSSFQSDSRFLAKKDFPHGLARSGEFTRAQVQLLETHGNAYEALHHGLRAPVTEEERRFVEVCSGLTAPESQHEKVWQRFCQAANKKPHISAFSSARLHDHEPEEKILGDDDWADEEAS